MKKLSIIIFLLAFFINFGCSDNSENSSKNGNPDNVDTDLSAVDSEEKPDSGQNSSGSDSKEKDDSDKQTDPVDKNDSDPTDENDSETADKDDSDHSDQDDNHIPSDDDSAADNDADDINSDSDPENDADQVTETPDESPEKPDYGGMCLRKCEKPADCVEWEGPTTKPHNYLCEEGFCKYLGCTKDEECAEQYYDDSYKCNKDSGEVAAQCVSSCKKSADCANEYSQPFMDADNYSCNAEGLCRYEGCNNTEECKSFGEGKVCVADPRVPTPHCFEGCLKKSDCTHLGSIYHCIEGHCVDSCQTDKECVEMYAGDTNYGCKR